MCVSYYYYYGIIIIWVDISILLFIYFLIDHFDRFFYFIIYLFSHMTKWTITSNYYY